MIDGTSRAIVERGAGQPGRAVMQRSHAVEEVRDDAARRRRPPRARRRSRPCCARARRRRRASRSIADRGEAGIGLGRERDEPHEIAEAVAQVGEPRRGRRDAAGRRGARRARHRGTGLRGARRAPRRAARRAPRASAFEHRRRTRRAARCRSSAGTRCSRRATSASIAATIVVDRCGREVDGAGAVHLDVDEAGREQRVAEVDGAVGRRRPVPVATMRPSADHDPRRRRRDAALAVEDAGAATSAVTRGGPGTTRCAASQAEQCTGHPRQDRRAGRAQLVTPRPGSRAVRRPARSTRRISSVSKRSWPESTRARTARPRRGASP